MIVVRYADDSVFGFKKVETASRFQCDTRTDGKVWNEIECTENQAD
jgi:hypothetical protein